MGPGVEQIIEVGDACGGHTQSQFEAVEVPILAGTVPPISFHKPAVPSRPVELTHRHRDDVDDALIFQVDAQLGDQIATELLDIATHGPPAKPEARLVGQWIQEASVMSLGMSQDGRFAFQTGQIAYQDQL